MRRTLEPAVVEHPPLLRRMGRDSDPRPSQCRAPEGGQRAGPVGEGTCDE